MNILQKLSSILLAVLIFMLGNLYVASTVASPKTIINTAKESNINEGLAEFIPKQIEKINQENPSSENAEFSKSISSLLSDEYITTKSQKVLTDFDQLFAGKTEKVVIDFQDLAPAAAAKGIDIDFSKVKPIEVSSEQVKVQKEVKKQAKLVQLGGLILATVLFLVSLLTGFISKNLKTLAISILTVGILFVITSGVTFIVSNLILSNLKLSGTAEPLSPYVSSILTSLANDAAKLYGFIALGIILVSIICFVINRIIKNKPSETRQDIEYREPEKMETKKPEAKDETIERP